MRALVPLLALAVAVSGCEREDREFRSEPAPAAVSQPVSLSNIYPGQANPPGPANFEYERNAYHISEGQRLFRWFNCNGCHANGGGGMGPPLMDDRWLYGSEPGNIFGTIVEGRPNGMPSFRGKIPDTQVWQLVAYVRAMSAQPPKDVRPGRADHMAARPSEQSMAPATPVDTGTPR